MNLISSGKSAPASNQTSPIFCLLIGEQRRELRCSPDPFDELRFEQPDAHASTMNLWRRSRPRRRSSIEAA